ncbi:MAG: ATP-binding protein, partial [Desulfobacterales bacterium]
INRKKDGSIYFEEQTITPVKDNEGQISHFIAIKQDVTDRRKTEKELLKYREKLEQMVEDRTKELKETQQELVSKAIEAGMAHVASMVLHNIGNAITPINTYMEKVQTNELGKILHYLEKCYDDLQSRDDDLDYYIKEDVRGKQVFSYMADLIRSLADKNEEQLEIFKKIESAIFYISEILSLQQSYSLTEREIREVVYLNSLLEDAVEMQIGTLETSMIIVKKQFEDNLPKFMIDKSKLMQVIVNLIKNSYEAIEAQKNNTKEKVVLIESFVENDSVGFKITDNGIGIEPEKIDKVFEFGKSRKGSTGFGLQYCKMFVESNGGTITLKSNGIGSGATVSVYFDMSRLRHDDSG